MASGVRSTWAFPGREEGHLGERALGGGGELSQYGRERSRQTIDVGCREMATVVKQPQADLATGIDDEGQGIARSLDGLKIFDDESVRPECRGRDLGEALEGHEALE